MPAAAQLACTVGKRIEPGAASRDDLGEHAARHDIAWRQLRIGMQRLHEPVAGAIDQGGALAAQRLGGERGRIAVHRDRGRMELDEFGVGDDRAGARRHHQAVAAGFGRVGGDRIEMADPTGRQHHRARRQSDALPAARGDDAADAALIGDELLRRHPGEHANIWSVCDRRNQRRHDGAAGGVALDMHDPPRRMGRLAGDLEAAGNVAVERHAERHEIAYPLRRLARHGERHAFVDQAGTGRDRIAGMRLRAVAIGHCRRDPALRPGGRGAVAERCGGEHRHRTRAELERAEQPGEPAADDDDVIAGDMIGHDQVPTVIC
jgi:hypothetical protein